MGKENTTIVKFENFHCWKFCEMKAYDGTLLILYLILRPGGKHPEALRMTSFTEFKVQFAIPAALARFWPLSRA